MTDPDELGRAVLAIAAALDALGARWAIGGSLASAAHGEPRATNDVDVIAELEEAPARGFCATLGPDFYADADVAAAAVRDRRSFNVIDTRSFIKIDVFVPGPGLLGLAQLDRRRMLPVLSGVHPLPVLGPEDTILQKLRWYALGGEVSDRQWRDILSVLRHGAGKLDDGYLDDVAARTQLADLLQRARSG